MAVVTLSSGASFQAPTDLTILDAASKAHIALPSAAKPDAAALANAKSFMVQHAFCIPKPA
jgi:hypothetical protein